MISIVLYGRNDNYGYNLHKRAALSFNCMAELLQEKADEIIFVDYNTPDDFPTFPEAILDTLTSTAREKLRVLRVRPRIHAQFKSKTHLVAIEPVARNIGIRRTNPANRWVLSTNTDMIFVTKGSPIKWWPYSLNDVVGDLPAGFYHAPRIEIPETLWESLDRMRPRKVIDTVRRWGPTLYLNEISMGSDIILYDGPGDFQLIERQDLFQNQGFNEDMLVGWHVDSNIAKRLGLIYGKVGDLGNRVYGYHCDHTRQITPMHGPTRVENDSRLFVNEVTRPDLPQQAGKWGFPNEDIEEIRLKTDPSRVYISGLLNVIGEPMKQPVRSDHTGAVYNKVNYDSRHVVPFLIDIFCPYPRTANIGWYGARLDTLRMFWEMWKVLGFSGSILIDASNREGLVTIPDAVLVKPEKLRSQAAAFVFDFGIPSDRPDAVTDNTLGPEAHESLISGLTKVIEAERVRLLKTQSLRRIVTVNAINNRYERFVSMRIGVGYTPFATRIRQGFVLPAVRDKQNWLPAMQAGDAGVRIGPVIQSRQWQTGTVAFGPYRYLDRGSYRLNIRLTPQLEMEDESSADEASVFVEVWSQGRLLSPHVIKRSEIEKSHEVLFEVTEAIASSFEHSVECRITSLAPTLFTITELTIETCDKLAGADFSSIFSLSNWLPLLRVGQVGRKVDLGIQANKGYEGFVVHGPYFPLPAGRYIMRAALQLLETGNDAATQAVIGRADVAAKLRNVLAAASITSDDAGEGLKELMFEVSTPPKGEPPPVIETRIWSSGQSSFLVHSVSVQPWTGRSWLAGLNTGEAGRWEQAAIKSRPNQSGCVANGLFRSLVAGRYRFEVELEADAKDEKVSADALAVILEARAAGRSIAAHGLRWAALSGQLQQMVFDVPATAVRDPDSAIEMRIVAARPVALTIHRASLEPVAETTVLSANSLLGIDWLSLLQTGPAGAPDNLGTKAMKGTEGYVFFGPYIPLPPGRYRAFAAVEPIVSLGAGGEADLGYFDVAAEGSHVLSSRRISSNDVASGGLEVYFEVAAPPASERPPVIETRLWTSGQLEFCVRSVSVTCWEGRSWLAGLNTGEAGRWDQATIKSRPGQTGCVAQRSFRNLAAGRYRFEVEFEAEATDDKVGADALTVIVEAKVAGRSIAAHGLCRMALSGQVQQLVFDLPERAVANPATAVEMRIVVARPVALTIHRASLDPVGETTALSANSLLGADWLPLLQTGPAGAPDNVGMRTKKGAEGYLAFGPYIPLPPGHYGAVVTFEPLETPEADVEQGYFDVAANGSDVLAIKHLSGADIIDGVIQVCFEVPTSPSGELPREIETRIFTEGKSVFRVHSLRVSSA